MRNLNIVLGDQLNADSSLFQDFDPAQDAVWMAEVLEESTHVWSHKARIAMFLSGMRHLAAALRERNMQVHYRLLGTCASFAVALQEDLARLNPERVRFVIPGDFRVREALKAAMTVPFDELPDSHFYSSPELFAQWAKGRRELRMEYFYRQMRKTHDVLMEGSEPLGGQWNFDHDNRQSFSSSSPPQAIAPRAFPPDAITQEVFADIERLLPTHPGSLAHFDWPVCSADAELALEDFIEQRLAKFGQFQDAMWINEPYLFHSRLSAALNLKMLSARKVVAAVEAAARDSRVPLNAAEGFIRQILGWREYVRGLYWLQMPAYLESNALGAQTPLPAFYWDAKTPMVCMQQTIQQTLDYGYANHIQRLMVTGLYALLLGVKPLEIHAWYLAVYVDAVEWVELPNVLGMSQYADGGKMASKPYIASGKYIHRMSNYCQSCRFKPDQSTGANACPFTTLYWDFLIRHEQRFARHPRLALQVRNLQRLNDEQRAAITTQAAGLKGRVEKS